MFPNGLHLPKRGILQKGASRILKLKLTKEILPSPTPSNNCSQFLGHFTSTSPALFGPRLDQVTQHAVIHKVDPRSIRLLEVPAGPQSD